MPDSEDYRKYLEEKFAGMQSLQHGYFREVHDRFDTIDKSNAVRNKRLEKVEDSIEELKEKEAEHVVNCPLVPKVENIEIDLIEYRFVKKHPNIMITVIAIAVIGVVFGLYKTFNNFASKVNEVEEKITNEIRLMDGVSKETRGGTVKYRDINGFTDSVKVR